MNGSEGSSRTPRTTAESPTWATYMRFPLITTMLAVVPDVLGRPVRVFGHSAKKSKSACVNKYSASTTQKKAGCVFFRGWNCNKESD